MGMGTLNELEIQWTDDTGQYADVPGLATGMGDIMADSTSAIHSVHMRGRKPESPQRDKAIREAVQAGETLQSVGDRYGLTRQRVWQIAKQPVRKACPTCDGTGRVLV